MISEISEKLLQTLKDLNIDKTTRQEFHREKIHSFFDTFLKYNTFITNKTLTGDFLNSLGFLVYKGNQDVGELRRVLSYSFKDCVNKAVKEGKIIKYNTNSYKVC